jgi:hypothetical protein
MNVAEGFSCSICGEPSSSICVYCTHDACGNHLCEKCGRCSDCCACAARVQTETKSDPHSVMHPVSRAHDSNLEPGGIAR